MPSASAITVGVVTIVSDVRTLGKYGLLLHGFDVVK